MFELKEYDAGVARELQFRLKHGNEWNTLARFTFAPFVWLASPKIDATSVKLFQQALLGDNSTARSELHDNYSAGYEVNIIPSEVDFVARLNQAFARERFFDTCFEKKAGPGAAPVSNEER